MPMANEPDVAAEVEDQIFGGCFKVVFLLTVLSAGTALSTVLLFIH